jgi:hypothetical protein
MILADAVPKVTSRHAAIGSSAVLSNLALISSPVCNEHYHYEYSRFARFVQEDCRRLVRAKAESGEKFLQVVDIVGIAGYTYGFVKMQIRGIMFDRN